MKVSYYLVHPVHFFIDPVWSKSFSDIPVLIVAVFLSPFHVFYYVFIAFMFALQQKKFLLWDDKDLNDENKQISSVKIPVVSSCFMSTMKLKPINLPTQYNNNVIKVLLMGLGGKLMDILIHYDIGRSDNNLFVWF